jgi:imidazolonepropionase-like amidohydrolase
MSAIEFHAKRGDFAIVNTNIVDVLAGRTVPAQTVVVRGDRIVAVASASTIDANEATVIDGRGRYLMPGLVDMHAHLYTDNDAIMFAAAGVTTVRNMAGTPAHLDWRAAVVRGERFGPTIVTAGPILDGGDPTPHNVVVKTSAEADAAVVGMKAAGYDFVKVHEGLSMDVYDAIAAAADREHIVFAGHASATVPLVHILEKGQRSIEHLTGYPRAILRADAKFPEGVDMVAFTRAIAANIDDRKLAAIAAATAKSSSWNCPTLAVGHAFARLDLPDIERGTRWLEFVDAKVRDGWADKRRIQEKDAAYKRVEYEILERITRAIATAGGKLLVGSDEGNAYVVAGASLHDELDLLAATGIPRATVLRAATAGAAEYFGITGRAGVIAVNARADLVLADADPLVAPISIPPVGVMLRGRFYDHAALEAKLEPLRTTSHADLHPTSSP